jgi:hypothetical protein
MDRPSFLLPKILIQALAWVQQLWAFLIALILIFRAL